MITSMKPGMLPVIKAYRKQEKNEDVLTEIEKFPATQKTVFNLRESNKAEGREIILAIKKLNEVKEHMSCHATSCHLPQHSTG